MIARSVPAYVLEGASPFVSKETRCSRDGFLAVDGFEFEGPVDLPRARAACDAGCRNRDAGNLAGVASFV